MVSDSEGEVVNLLQDLGLREYEAKCFAALTRLSTGTAKRISETTEVPRTRVYEAVRVLESSGLVEIQQGNPQQYRAVEVDEAVGLLENRYSSRIGQLERALQSLRSQRRRTTRERHDVESLSGASITDRMRRMVGAGVEEVVLLIGKGPILTEEFYESLQAAATGEATVLVGVVHPEVRAEISDRVPDVAVFEPNTEWFEGPETDPNEISITALVLVDRSELLVSTLTPTEDDRPIERATYVRGPSNGFVVIARRLLSDRLRATHDLPE